MYDGKVLSIDIHQPDEPLSFIIEKNAEHYCFPRNSIPIFIRPCHSNFVHNTILKNRNKFDEAIYVSLPKNLDGDLDDRFYKITQYSEWEDVYKRQAEIEGFFHDIRTPFHVGGWCHMSFVIS